MHTRLLCAGLAAAAYMSAAEPALTIYNQNFAVIRETVPLELHRGENNVSYSGVTSRLEPDSVILRDPSGKAGFRILEQNYRADPISQDRLLSLFEGKTIDFQIQPGQIVRGKVVRGTALPGADAQQSPVIEMDGRLLFFLPGQPMFPAMGNDTILKPVIDWVLQSDGPSKIDAELAYVSDGMTWAADYNIISIPKSESVDLIGWVTFQNQTGKTFENARIKLMAGDVNKIRPIVAREAVFTSMGAVAGMVPGPPPVTEKAFDEYHLYTLERPTTIHDKETKQVEFVRAHGVGSKQIYVYDGLKTDNRYQGWNAEMIRNDMSYGTISNNKIWVMREFKNSAANRLGIPLPAGRVRFYRQDEDGQLEFTGEDSVPHTPRDETVRVFTGAAFDLTGERRRVNFRNDVNRQQMDESFEITLRNHKTEAVEIRVVEHLYRWSTWEIQLASLPYAKTDAQTIEFRVSLAPEEQKTVSYNAHYTW